MSELAIESENEGQRRVWLAVLAGWLTVSTLVWLAALAFVEYDNRRLDAGDAFEGDGVIRPPASFTADWLETAAVAYGRIALVALAYGLPLLLVAARLERDSERAPGAWRTGGIAAMVPLIVAWEVIVLLSPDPSAATLAIVPPLFFALFGMAGGAAARRVRHAGA